MTSFDEELRLDEEENAREVEFIRSQLPPTFHKLYSKSDLLWMIDTIVEYYYSSGILDSKDDEVDIDMEVIANYVCKKAVEEGVSKSFNPDEVLFIVQADLDFQEQNL